MIKLSAGHVKPKQFNYLPKYLKHREDRLRLHRNLSNKSVFGQGVFKIITLLIFAMVIYFFIEYFMFLKTTYPK
jgi:hypothetical protein